MAVFLASQLVQGASRALFWTASQTHAVRTSSSSVVGLRNVNLAAGLGAFLGPAVAGSLWNWSVQLPFLMGAAVGLIAIIPAALLLRLPVFPAKATVGTGEEGYTRDRQVLRAACWMNAVAGAWKGLLDSYVPVALSLAGQPATVVGSLLAVANGTVLAGSAAGGWVRRRGIGTAVALGVLTAGLGVAAVGPLAGLTLAAASVLAVSGTGAGILQTVGPALATELVPPGEQGDVLALTGTFRTMALFLTPLGMSLLVTIVPVGAAVLAGGGACSSAHRASAPGS